tara:strand:- start:499 stop:792 length:294 start_codon:yes stop_codon:yes gene_type:complete
MNLNKRDQTEILEYLKLITSELTDAYNTGSTEPENSDSLYYIDTARDLIDELTTNVEDNQEASVPHEDMGREGGLQSSRSTHNMGPDGLPLNFPFEK